MFWKFNQLSPQIDTVLFKEDTILNEVLDQENVLQELKSQNTKLIEFITRADILNQLVSLIIDEPSSDLEEHEKYRRPNLACEILTTDIPIVNERLSDKALLTKLYSFLERDPPLNPLLASFFSRTLSMLICRKADQHWYSYQFTCLQFLDFLKTRENSLNLLLKHLDTSAIMDLTLKLMTQIEGNEMQQNLISWVESEGLIENIIALFDPKVDEGRHYNAAQLLCDTIRKCREISERNEPDPMLTSIQSPDIIKTLLDNMLKGEHIESSIVGGISVLLTLLEPYPSEQQNNRRGMYNNTEDTGSGEPPPSPNPALSSIVSSIIPYLPALHELLLNPPKKPPIKLACGTIEPPLGNTRLTVIKLIAALIATNTPEVNEVLDELNTVHVLLDLFFHYTWNNFLHSQVDKCLAFALNSSGQETSKNPLIHNIFIKCRLLQRILEASEENESEQNKTGGKRRGYMGHLTNIANSVIKQGDCLGEFINENIDKNTLVSWHNYVETTLQPTNDLHQRFLGGSHPAHSSGKEEHTAFVAGFSTEANVSQEFQDFSTSATLSSNYIENFSVLNSDNSWGNDHYFDCSGSDDELVTAKKKPEEDGNMSFQLNPWLESKGRFDQDNDNEMEEGWADFTSFNQHFPPHVDPQPNSSIENENLEYTKNNESNSPVDENIANECPNANDLVLEDVVPENELIDNFRFLSVQGMISEKKVNPDEANPIGFETVGETKSIIIEANPQEEVEITENKSSLNETEILTLTKVNTNEAGSITETKINTNKAEITAEKAANPKEAIPNEVNDEKHHQEHKNLEFKTVQPGLSYAQATKTKAEGNKRRNKTRTKFQ